MRESFRAVSLLLVMLLLAALVSCYEQTDKSSSGTPPVTEATTAPDESDVISISTLTVVRPDKNVTETVINEAVRVYNAIEKISGVKARIISDFIRPGTEHDAAAYEILVGNTDYKETTAALSELKESGYSITVNGNKIVIVSRNNDEYLLQAAVNDFIGRLESYITGSEFKFDRTLSVTVELSPVLDNNRLEYTLAVGGNNTTANTKSSQKVYTGCSEKTYRDYIASLLNIGNGIVAENKIGNNIFTTLEDSEKKTLITAYYLGNSRKIRVVTEPWQELVKELPSAQPAGSCDTTIMQLECTGGSEQADVIRLSDGRFVLYDTGTASAASRLMEYMRENNIFTDGKIHIAAIFISHPHSDHMNGLTELAEKYSSELAVETVWANFIAGSIQSVYSASTLENLFQTVRSSSQKLGATLCFARSGQKLTVAGADFEILFTPEDLGDYTLDDSDTGHDMNNTCLIVRAKIAGQTLLFVGDSRGGQSPIAAEMYKEALKCDIMTVTHHGYNVVGAMALYDYAKPTVLLWPNNFYDTSRAFVNRLLKATYVKEHLLADRRHILILPYQPAD